MGEPMRRTAVDYNSALLKDLEEILLQNIPSGLQPWARVGHMSRWYQDSRTNGMLLAAIGRHLRSAGYSPNTHCAIGWSSYADYVTFHRALLGRSMVLDNTDSAQLRSLKDVSGEETLQPFNLCSLVR
jgi:hypothetical protein